jgi:hypothetical protein
MNIKMEALSELGVLVFKLAMEAGVIRSSSKFPHLFTSKLYGKTMFRIFNNSQQCR